MKKKLLALTLVLAMVLCLLAGCGSAQTGTDTPADEAPKADGKDILNDEIKIAFICSSATGVTTNQYYVVFDEYFSIYDNVKWQIFDGQFDVTIQNNCINECITQGYDAIICEVLDAEACNTAIAEAEAAGIPFIDINPGATGPHTLHIQGADYAMGWQGASELTKVCNDTGNVIIFSPPAAQVATSRQGTGAREYFEQNSNMTIIDEQYIDDWSTENANTIMTNLLTKYDPGTIQAVYCASDDMALGVVQALKNAGRNDEGIKIWGGNGTPNGLQAILDGDLYGTSFCNQYAEMCCAISTALFLISVGSNGYELGVDYVPTINYPISKITPENAYYPMALWDYCLDYYATMDR